MKPASRYVCSEHTNRGVTWRGTGCVECDERRRTARARRIARRAAQA